MYQKKNKKISCAYLELSLSLPPGDNALDYVIEGAKVSAVDFNSCQIALCELKVCGGLAFIK